MRPANESGKLTGVRFGADFSSIDPPRPLNLKPLIRNSCCGASMQQEGVSIMQKVLGLFFVAAAMTASVSTNALAWDNCGHGAHRNYAGYCVSNYGRSSGCPYGYHLGWNVRECVPN
jgi:hypothetical protein